MPLGSFSSASAASQTIEVLPIGTPGAAPGWRPGGPPLSSSASGGRGVSSSPTPPQTFPPFSAPSSPTDFANFAPFQRFTWPGDLRLYPVSTVGKLFFTQTGQNFVCSASVIGRSTLATAGHCVHAGNNLQSGFSTNVLFCPSFSPVGRDPVRGCWPGIQQVVSFQWFNASNVDRDYGCIVTRATGDKIANKIGNITGWTGRAWNWPSSQPILAWGYPQGAPFAGNRLITTTSTEWYQLNRNASESQLSKYIGSDQTGGSSGGPWWLNFVGRRGDRRGRHLADHRSRASATQRPGSTASTATSAAASPVAPTPRSSKMRWGRRSSGFLQRTTTTAKTCSRSA